ncbi:S46 family peptidase [Rheinheimera sp. WS51]|uniref:S46 family peptidase n=1 Tax=Rheinheimera sp. WS51 TaxID=3425886 RepID=UPI003D91D148
MKLCRIVSATLLLGCFAVTAQEGFWQASQSAEIAAQLVKQGAKLKAQSLHKLIDLSVQASVKVNNCSGVFISKRGLVLTNYNCIADKIGLTVSEHLSSDLTGLSPDSELPLTDVQLTIPQQTEDVTLIIKRQLDSSLSAVQQQFLLQQLTKQLVTECEQETKLNCQIHADDTGLKYSLVKSFTSRDVRLVFTPNDALARLGQRQDVATWPQYNSDYVFLRAYTDVQGQSAAYELKNIPYQSKHFLTLSNKGISDGEPVLVAGYPTTSERYQTASALARQFEQLMPLQIDYYQQALELLQQQTKTDQQLAAKYQDQIQQLKHIMAKQEAKLARFQHSSVFKNKLAKEQKLQEWISGSPVRQELYTQILQQVFQLNQQQHQQALRDLTLKNLSYVQLPTLAQQLYHYAMLRENDQASSLALQLAKKQLMSHIEQIEQNFDSRIDQSLAVHFLAEYAKLPAELRLADLDHYFALNDGFNLEIVRHKLAAIYRGSQLNDPEQRNAWLTASVKQFEQSQDTLISFAVAMQASHEKLSQHRLQLKAKLNQAWPAYVEVWQAFNDANNQSSYADANGTIRLSMATVKGYQPRDAVWYQAFSSATGLIENFAHLEQSSAIQRIIQQLVQTKQQQLPVNFLSSADITSGHAGAMTLNLQGDIVGLVTGGACETVISPWHYDEKQSRAIHLDARYIIWQLQQNKAANALLTELNLGH